MRRLIKGNGNDVWKKLSGLLNDINLPTFGIEGKNYALLSDTHLGNGGLADDFHENETALMNALDYYQDRKFHLILVGDIEEFWQYELASIKKRYQDTIYSRMRKFPDGHLTRIFGNHDYEWGGFIDPLYGNSAACIAPEAVKLVDEAGEVRIMLVHGHQGSLDADKYSWFSRFWVHLFLFVEPFARKIGMYSNPSATKSQIPKDFERTLYQWAKANKILFICGHSHRAIFASKSYAENVREEIAHLEAENSKINLEIPARLENIRKILTLEKELVDEKSKGRVIGAMDPDREPLPCYFNTGCGVYSDGLTAIEIENDTIRLVRWNRNPSPNNPDRQVHKEKKLSPLLDEIAAN